MPTINQTVNKFTAYYGCPSSLSSLGHDSAPMGNRIRALHGKAVPSEKDFWDISTQHYPPSKRRCLTTQWRSVQTNWILCYTAVKIQNSLSGHTIPLVPILGHISSIHVLINYLTVTKMPLRTSKMVSDCVCRFHGYVYVVLQLLHRWQL